jgi:DNA ligase (NAD+)
MPAQCPLCGADVVKPEGEAMHRCPNPACESRGLETLINWVQGPADIEGVGEETIRRLWAEGLVRSLPDLYRLTKEQLLELDGFGDVSASNAIEAIKQSKDQVPFWRVLLGLNIPDVGWVTARSLGSHFGSVDQLEAATQEDVQQVDGIGPERAEAIVEWFADEQNRNLIAELRKIGLRLVARPDERPKEGPLTGNTYVITGTLESMSREQAAAALEELGAKVTSSVSAKTTGLIVGEEPGNSKLTKAQKVGTPIVSEGDLLELLSAK